MSLRGWSKRCPCCGELYGLGAWRQLPFVGTQETSDETGAYLTELRNCVGERPDGQPCGSTIGVEWPGPKRVAS